MESALTDVPSQEVVPNNAVVQNQVVPVAPDGTVLLLSRKGATGYKGVALSTTASDTAAYRVEYAQDRDGNIAPKGAGVRKTRYFESCMDAATWYAASLLSPHSSSASPHVPRVRRAC